MLFYVHLDFSICLEKAHSQVKNICVCTQNFEKAEALETSNNFTSDVKFGVLLFSLSAKEKSATVDKTDEKVTAEEQDKETSNDVKITRTEVRRARTMDLIKC